MCSLRRTSQMWQCRFNTVEKGAARKQCKCAKRVDAAVSYSAALNAQCHGLNAAGKECTMRDSEMKQTGDHLRQRHARGQRRRV